MKLVSFLKNSILALSAFGIVAPQASLAVAADLGPTVRQSQSPAISGDVRLTPNNQLVGQVVNGQGIARQQAVVTVATLQGEIVGQTKTDAKGNFSAELPKGGVYVVSTAKNSSAVRVWTNSVAPPAAQPGVLMVDDVQAVRGQILGGGGGGGGLLILGAAGLTAVIIADNVDQNSGS